MLSAVYQQRQLEDKIPILIPLVTGVVEGDFLQDTPDLVLPTTGVSQSKFHNRDCRFSS